LGSDSELNMTQDGGTTIVGNSQEGHIQITMVASRQDSNAEVTSAERTSTKSPLPTHPDQETPDGPKDLTITLDTQLRTFLHSN
jgi:hypothetical protein